MSQRGRFVGMRAIARLVALVILAIAVPRVAAATPAPTDNTPLPAVADRPVSAASLRRAERLALHRDNQREQAELADDRDLAYASLVAELRATVTAEPGAIGAWIALANAYADLEDRAHLHEVLEALRTSACDRCIDFLLGFVYHHDDLVPDGYEATIHGRTSPLTEAATALTSLDPAATRRWLGAHRAVQTSGPHAATLAGREAVLRWMSQVSRVNWSAGGLLSCGARCCHLANNGQGADATMRLVEMCFAPGPELATMRWEWE